MKHSFNSIVQLIRQTFKVWGDREPFNNSIVVAYYTIFSLPGLLVIVINLAGYFFGKDTVTEEISTQIGGLIGSDTVSDVEGIVSRASESDGTVLSTILSVATLLFGATGVFYHVQQILNKIWEVEPKPKQRIIGLIRARLFSFGLVLIVGFLLLVSLVLSAAVTALTTWAESYLADATAFLFTILDFVLSLGMVTILFAAIFKFLPDVKISWRDVWPGAFLTAILFTIAKVALGFYFGKSDPSSAYGAAGTIVLIMLWVSYAGLILFFGAEFTRVYMDSRGKKPQPVPTAKHRPKEEKSRDRVFGKAV